MGLTIAAMPVLAADFTVQNGQTVGSQTLTAAGDVGSIEDGGTIATAAGDGVRTAGGVDGVTINNAGSVSSTGDDAIDVRDDNTITNRGTLTTSGDNALEARHDNTITNSGTITSSGDDAVDIENRNTITNTGTISSSGDDAIDAGNRNTIINHGTLSSTGDSGIQAGNRNTILNTGTITSSVDNGVEVDNRNTITNTGLISSTGDDGVNGDNNNTVNNSGTIRGNDEGIDLGNNSTIINSGSVFGDEAIEIGRGTIFNSGLIQGTSIAIDNTNSVLALTNSGTIIGTGGNAIDFGGGGDTLSLLPGSNIQGTISFGGGSDTLVVAPGLSISNTFAGTLPETIRTSGVPFVVNGLQVAVVDPTAISMHDEMIVDLTNGVSYAVFGALKAARNGRLSNGATFAKPQYLSREDSRPEYRADRSTRYWSRTFGVARNEDGRGPSVEARNEVVGSVYGVDAPLWHRSRIGAFVGGSIGEVATTYDSQKTRTKSFYGGIYAGTQMGSVAFDLLLTGGHTSLDRKRDVANNLAAGGMQIARAKFDGVFIAPEASVTVNTGAGIVASGSIRYIGYRMGSFREAGAADNFSVSGRTLQIINGRFQLARPFFANSENGSMIFEPYIGIEARSLLSGNTVDASLLGQSISFSPGGETATASAFAGFNLSAGLSSNIDFYSNIEASFESHDSHSGRASFGFKFRF